MTETFNGDKGLKKELLNKLKHHQELDAFIQGDWLTDVKVKGNGFKGCFYGCTMQTDVSPIEKFSEKYNIDLWYCYLTEKIFEGLPDGEYQSFPYDSINALPVGFDINKIKSPFFYRLLMDEERGQITFANGNEQVEKAIEECAELFKTDFDKISESAAESAWSAAWSARSAWSAAESAAWSAAESAAWSAESARSAAWSARSAESAAWSAWSAARSNYYLWLRDLLFEIINQNK